MSDNKSMKGVEEERLFMIRNWGNRNFTNELEQMLSTQRKFLERFIELNSLTTPDKERWSKEMILAIIDELSEVLNKINFKHWKKREEVEWYEIAYELIDIQHFINNLYLIWGMDHQTVFSMYLAKSHENIRRQQEGY